MVKIRRKDNPYEEEYINEAYIIRCWKKKDVKEEAEYKAVPCYGVIIPDSFNLQKIEERTDGIASYRDKATGEEYIFVEAKFFPNDYWDKNKITQYNGLYPGWNKVIEINGEWDYKYFIEYIKGKAESKANLEFGGITKKESKYTEIIEIDEDGYKKIVGE